MSFYNGTRLDQDEVDDRNWDINHSTITLDDIEDVRVRLRIHFCCFVRFCLLSSCHLSILSCNLCVSCLCYVQKTVIDVAYEHASTSVYCGSLAHKSNHCFDPKL